MCHCRTDGGLSQLSPLISVRCRVEERHCKDVGALLWGSWDNTTLAYGAVALEHIRFDSAHWTCLIWVHLLYFTSPDYWNKQASSPRWASVRLWKISTLLFANHSSGKKQKTGNGFTSWMAMPWRVHTVFRTPPQTKKFWRQLPE